MEELTSLIRKNGETLDCNDWNKLVIAINTIISFYNAYPTKLSEFENDLEFVSYNSVVAIVQELIQSGIIPSTEGLDGKSAYQVAVDNGFNGTEQQWLVSLQGEVGKSAYQLAVLNGFTGTTQQWLQSLKGQNGQDGQNGLHGKSAFELAVEEGFDGTLQQWLDSLKGEDGTPGQDGSNGINGTNGKSAYELAVDLGYEGTLEQWFNSLKGQNGTNGQNGINGKSAYQSYLDTTTDNPPLTEQQWSANVSNGSSRFTDENEEITYNVNSNNHNYVDLCLPSGTLWSSMNLGASSIQDEGLWYTWGGLQGYTLQQIDGHQAPFPYNNQNIEILPIEYDAARANWGGDWEIPTENQVKELVNYTTKEVIQIEGIKVLKLISKLNSQKYIYFPLYTKDVYINTQDNCYHIQDWYDSQLFYIWLKEGEYYHPSDSQTIYADGIMFKYGPGYSTGSYNTYDRENLSLIRPVINNPDGYHRRLQEICFTGSYKDLHDISISYKDLTDAPKNVSDFKNNNFYLTPSSINNQYLTAPSYLVDSYRNSHYCDNLFGTYWSDVDIGQDSTHSQGMLFRAGDPTGHYPSENFQFTEQSYRDYLSQKNPDDYYLIVSEQNIYNPVSQNFGIHWRYPTRDDIKNLYIYFEAEIKRYSDSEELQFRKVGSDSGISISFRLTTPYGAMTRIKDGVAYLKEKDYTIYEYKYRGGTNYFQNLEKERYGGYTIRPILNIPKEVSRVAITGDYNNLINKPTIPAAQIQADWNQTDNTQVDYIKNKPAIINGTDGVTPHIDSTSKHWMIGETDTGIVAEGQNGQNGTNGTNGTDGVTPHIDSTTGNWFIGNTDTGVHAQGPAGQGGSGSGVQSDWNETDNTSLAYIANKPTIPTVPSNETATLGGSTLSVVTTGDKYNWNNKASIWSGTQAQYDALSPNYDSNTIYIITAAS